MLIYGDDTRWTPSEDRYEKMPYRRVGDSGLKLPAISLGLWHNFGDDKPLQTQKEILRRAFDLGVTHFDLANNYGPPAGSAELNFGRILREDFADLRQELVISSKAGWDMWPGPYGFGGSRKYLVDSLDQSLERMGLDRVDIFYHHRPDPETPLEETMAALDHIVRSGRASYVGISSYSADLTARAQRIMRELGTPLTIHQPSYSMLNRWIETPSPDSSGPAQGRNLVQTLTEQGMGSIVFSPLAQGMLSDKYLDGVPEDSRAAAAKSLDPEWLSEENLEHVRALNEMARSRGQSLAQMAIAWTLREQDGGQVTTALVGASKPSQIENSVAAIENLEFTQEEVDRIDELAVDAGVNIWAKATESTD
ncbi:L-glyceraldehyde 3-phosphate reductase [Kocuria coralli]|uniref:L-glyceraldehyde 3-phosphate reductase n=1 Tax=Kocuria coralli TaxID=1461025 RepID=A0A5J5KZP8_9MICC|nr:L-glyceraldehyde 3-phosphate reductase [Kocuria coralli]KAA9395159.1 L-glyceraldehyde 3-phosphate reductase [Kocuria coralli]